MKRFAAVCAALAALGGCVSTEQQAPVVGCGWNGSVAPPTVPGVQGPWGQPVNVAAPYAYGAPSGDAAARAMLSRSVPLDLVQMANAPTKRSSNSGIVQASAVDGMPGGVTTAGGGCCAGGGPPGAMAPPGMPAAPPMPGGPGGMGMGMPGMGMPGMGMGMPAGAVAAAGALPGGVPSQFPTHRTSVRFLSPAGMKVAWYAPGPGGGGFSNNQLVVPGRYNFVQAAIYRLKLSNISNRPGLELYPTLEVVPSNMRTDTFLAHSAVPVAFSDEDFDQVAAGNFLVKVIYLPFPQFQDLATTGPDEVVSSRLEPGVDPIAEACRRGNILAVVRMGNIDLEAPNTPAMDAPSPYAAAAAAHGPAGMPGMPGMGPMAGGAPGPMVPYGFMTSGRPLQFGNLGPVVPPSALPMPGQQLPAGALPPGAVPAPARMPAGPSAGPAKGPGPVSSAAPTGNGTSYNQVSGVQMIMDKPASNAQLAGESAAPPAKPDARSWWEQHWSSDDAKPSNPNR